MKKISETIKSIIRGFFSFVIPVNVYNYLDFSENKEETKMLRESTKRHGAPNSRTLRVRLVLGRTSK